MKAMISAVQNDKEVKIPNRIITGQTNPARVLTTPSTVEGGGTRSPGTSTCPESTGWGSGVPGNGGCCQRCSSGCSVDGLVTISS